MSQRKRQQKKHKRLTGEQLACYRKVAGMTQHDVGRETGISFHRLAYAETDRLELSKQETDILIRLYKRNIDQAIAAIEFPWNGKRASATRSASVRGPTAIGTQTDGPSAGGKSEPDVYRASETLTPDLTPA